MILLMIIPVIISLYYSCNYNYQPQGRYLYPSLFPLMMYVTFGYNILTTKHAFFKKIKNVLLFFVFVFLLIMSIVIYLVYLKGNIEVMIPELRY